MRLEGPVLNGSGTFDAIAARRAFGDALLERFPFHAFVSKTITLEPREGNPPPRLWETPAGMINSIGLPNKGLEGFLAHDLPRLAELPVPLIVSVMGFSRDELAELVARVGERPEVAMLELNVSCPNVESGLVMGADPGETARAVERVRPLTELPIVVKLTPNAADPAAVAAAAEDAGRRRGVADQHAQGDGARPRRAPDRGSAAAPGGLSGPAVRAVALEQVHSVAARVRNTRDRHGRDRLGARRGRFPGRRRHLRGRRHRKLSRPGRRPPGGLGAGDPRPQLAGRVPCRPGRRCPIGVNSRALFP